MSRNAETKSKHCTPNCINQTSQYVLLFLRLNNMSYCKEILGQSVMEKLEAGAFRSLSEHLAERSDSVSNMDLMTLSGFCRNCLAKWMVLEARTLANSSSDATVKQALDGFGYEDAAEHVYGLPYKEWKTKYQRKATPEQLEAYNASKHNWAQHDKELLEPRAPKSNVCCQVVDEPQPTGSRESRVEPRTASVVPAPLPPLSAYRNKSLPKIGVLTVSDRAFRNEYETGDLSGPAVVKELSKLLNLPSWHDIETAIVPDDAAAIVAKCQNWNGVDLILTTGGTGFGPRDVTPEATRELVDVELPHIMSFCMSQTSAVQPLSTLSRGTAGLFGKHTVIANLPGNPKSIGEILPLLLPLLLHAIVDLQHETPEVLQIE